MVTARGGWNGAPWIGFRIDAFDIDHSSEPYAAVERDIRAGARARQRTPDRIRAPASRGQHDATGLAVRSGRGNLLFTTDRDDFMEPEVGHNTGGLYRVIYGPQAVNTSSIEAPVPYDMGGTSLSGMIGGNLNFSLQRLAVMPCARQMAVSDSSRLLFVSTLGVCAHSQGDDTDIDRGAIWVVELDTVTGAVRRKARHLPTAGHRRRQRHALHSPSGRGVENRGNCVLRTRRGRARRVGPRPGNSLAYGGSRVGKSAVASPIQPAGHSRGHAWPRCASSRAASAYVVSAPTATGRPTACPQRPTRTPLPRLRRGDGCERRWHGIRSAVGMWFDPVPSCCGSTTGGMMTRASPEASTACTATGPMANSTSCTSRVAWLHNETSVTQ